MLRLRLPRRSCAQCLTPPLGAPAFLRPVPHPAPWSALHPRPPLGVTCASDNSSKRLLAHRLGPLHAGCPCRVRLPDAQAAPGATQLLRGATPGRPAADTAAGLGEAVAGASEAVAGAAQAVARAAGPVARVARAVAWADGHTAVALCHAGMVCSRSTPPLPSATSQRAEPLCLAANV
eukprot:356693-Chlamydomonas_euryale.AAC.1